MRGTFPATYTRETSAREATLRAGKLVTFHHPEENPDGRQTKGPGRQQI